jgi:hypothetical protein
MEVDLSSRGRDTTMAKCIYKTIVLALIIMFMLSSGACQRISRTQVSYVDFASIAVTADTYINLNKLGEMEYYTYLNWEVFSSYSSEINIYNFIEGETPEKVLKFASALIHDIDYIESRDAFAVNFQYESECSNQYSVALIGRDGNIKWEYYTEFPVIDLFIIDDIVGFTTGSLFQLADIHNNKLCLLNEQGELIVEEMIREYIPLHTNVYGHKISIFGYDANCDTEIDMTYGFNSIGYYSMDPEVCGFVDIIDFKGSSITHDLLELPFNYLPKDYLSIEGDVVYYIGYAPLAKRYELFSHSISTNRVEKRKMLPRSIASNVLNGELICGNYFISFQHDTTPSKQNPNKIDNLYINVFSKTDGSVVYYQLQNPNLAYNNSDLVSYAINDSQIELIFKSMDLSKRDGYFLHLYILDLKNFIPK